MRWSFMVLMAAVACGRVGFQPLIDGSVATSGGDSGSSGVPPNDGRSIVGDGSATIDASASACAAALDATVAAPVTTSTCVGGDHLKGCGPNGTQEVIFKFVAPATSGYNFAAYDHGTLNVSDSTAELDPGCSMAETCSGILGLTMNQNDVLYFIVESSSGGCDTIDFTVTES